MLELEKFFNDGFGWRCKSCIRNKPETSEISKSRLLREGEAETKTPRLSMKGLAQWLDEEQKVLLCSRCDARETVR